MKKRQKRADVGPSVRVWPGEPFFVSQKLKKLDSVVEKLGFFSGADVFHGCSFHLILPL